MKTPRELLLAQHQAVAPKLDRLRERVVDAAEPSRMPRQPRRARFAEAWSEFFRIPRIAWAGLAAAWVVIIALNVASSETPPPKNRYAKAAPPRSPEMLQALREQRQLFAELVGSAPAPDAEAQRFVPRPRSEKQVALIAV